MKNLGTIAWWLVVIGALNWGADVLGYNVVDMLLGGFPMVATIVYALVGLSGVYVLAKHFELV
jgi:uncharacterized membrane protein YuzA (DUF378 family)